MSDRIDDLATDVKKVQHGLEEVKQALTTLSHSVDERFTQVDAAFVEQRQYTESAYERLDTKMDAGFARLERKLDQFIDVQLTTNDLVDRRSAPSSQGGGGRSPDKRKRR